MKLKWSNIILIPATLILPITLLSCSSNNSNVTLLINEIVKLKLLPTLKIKPETEEINLADYFNNSNYQVPELDEKYSEIQVTIESIEYPVSRAEDLKIWIKVSPREYNDHTINSDKLYAINFTDILKKEEINYEKIIPITDEALIDNFRSLLLEKREDFSKLINDAFFANGEFSNLLPITDEEKILEEFKARLTAKKINEIIFNNLQDNINMKYKISTKEASLFNINISSVSFDFFLGEINNNNPISINDIEPFALNNQIKGKI